MNPLDEAYLFINTLSEEVPQETKATNSNSYGTTATNAVSQNNDTSSDSNSNMNFNNFSQLTGSGSAPSASTSTSDAQQQLIELMASFQQQNGGGNNNNDASSSLQQYQFLANQQQQQPQQVQQQQQFSQSNFNAQLASFMQNQQQGDFGGQPQRQRQHSLSLAPFQQQQGQTQQLQQSMTGVGGMAQQQLQPQQQQQSQTQQQQQLLSSNASANALLALQRQMPTVARNNLNASSLNAGSMGNSGNNATTSNSGNIMNNNNNMINSNNNAIRGVTTANNNSNDSAAALSKQKSFLLFIKVLLKCLDTTGNHVLKDRTKAIVGECTRRNRMGDPAFMPLQDAVEARLRVVVGEDYWTRAQRYVQSYPTKQPQLLQRASQNLARSRVVEQQQRAANMLGATRGNVHAL